MLSSTPTRNLNRTLNPLVPTEDYHILVIEDFNGKQSIPLSYATYSLGRDQSNTIQLKDPAISRQHLILLRVPLKNRQYSYRVVDGDANGKASLNGMTVNGISCRHKDLVPGDIIRIGDIVRITYLVMTMTLEDYNWYFNRKDTRYRSIQAELMDPNATMNTILAH